MALPFEAKRREGVGGVRRRWEEGASWDCWWPGLDLRVCITWGLCPGHVQAVDVLLGSKGTQRCRVPGGYIVPTGYLCCGLGSQRKSPGQVNFLLLNFIFSCPPPKRFCSLGSWRCGHSSRPITATSGQSWQLCSGLSPSSPPPPTTTDTFQASSHLVRRAFKNKMISIGKVHMEMSVHG